MNTWTQRLGAAIITVTLAATLAALSVRWSGHAATHGQLTIQIRVTNNIVTTCREYTADELRTIPTHMRRTQFCTRAAVAYHLLITIDNDQTANTILAPHSEHDDHPLHADIPLALAPGAHHVQMTLAPERTNAASLATYALDRTFTITAGRIAFVRLDETAGKFVVSE